VVWSDPRIQKLASEFVPCTEEVDILFPRNDYLINKLKDDPGKVLFTDVYGPQVPRQHWNERGTFTKQGVYCMMPDGTYLGARFAGTRVEDIHTMLVEAVARWKTLVSERGLKPKPVPKTVAFSEWEQKESSDGLFLELHYRDLPRAETKDSRGRKIGESWNRSAFKFSKEQMKHLVPAGNDWQEIDQSLIDRLIREEFKDIVYGQSPRWNEDSVKSASLKMRRLSSEGGRTIIGYSGKVILDSGSHRFSPEILGKAVWNGERFTAFEWVAIGPRSGGTKYNFREGDMDEAPMGISLVLADGE